MEEMLNRILNEIEYMKGKQKEHRKETAFQSNQLQIEISKLRSDLSTDISSLRLEMNSNFRHLENVIQVNRGAIELLDERTGQERNRD